MARFPEQFVQQVSQATDIVELISQYVALKKRGKEFVGLCPFHDDKNPSLNVSPTKQIFKCFACGSGGGVYQFLMLYEKLTFPEAVRSLCERANIPLPDFPREASADEGGFSKQDLIAVTTFAGKFFRERLGSPEGAAVLQYAHGRGLTDESIDRFGVGYAPDEWDSLLRAARTAGIGESKLVSAGLARRKEGSVGCYDRFRNRLIFPIADAQGRVIAFGGRAMGTDERAKYLNSPESPLFDKSAVLYALNFAREQIVSSGRAVVVEGYLDALIPLQMGVGNVVATLGTALTDRHVRTLSRYVREVVLVFDSDTAGRAAAERALEIFLAQRVHVRVASVPEGKDPCDFCLSDGPEAFERLIAAAPDALEYVWKRRWEQWASASGDLADRRRLVDEFLNLVASCSAYGAIDEIRRGQLAQHIGHLLNVSPAELQQQMQRLARRVVPGRGSREAPASPRQVRDPSSLAQRHILEVLVNRGDLFEQVAKQLDLNDFTNEQYRRIAESLWSEHSRGAVNLEELLGSEELSDLGALITDLVSGGERRGNYEQTLSGAVEHMVYLRRRSLERLGTSRADDDALREISKRLKNPDVRRHPKIS